MLEKALLIAMLCGGLMVLASVAEHFAPLALLADHLGSMNCGGEGWSAEACAR